jgi:hypothetical protein
VLRLLDACCIAWLVLVLVLVLVLALVLVLVLHRMAAGMCSTPTQCSVVKKGGGWYPGTVILSPIGTPSGGFTGSQFSWLSSEAHSTCTCLQQQRRQGGPVGTRPSCTSAKVGGCNALGQHGHTPCGA